ncbi:MAG: hypothetical protein RIF41_19765 [Polyangiaceae bacterium]
MARLPLLLVLLSSTGCSDAVPVPDGYPPRPHGTEVGDVFGYFTAMGYRAEPGATALASSAAFEPVDMLDVKESGPSHVLMHLAAMW